MKARSLAGNVGIGIFLVALVCVCVAFGTPAWLVSDYRITNAKLNRLGLWSHCFRSLPNPREADAATRIYVGCRWVYDRFTTGYSEIRGFLLPPFMVATQFFFTVCFLSFLIALGLIVLYATCWDHEQRYYLVLIKAIGYLLAFGSVCGCIAVIVFACLGNTNDWMPGHDNNYLSWSFALGVIGSVLGLIASVLFLVDAYIQQKKRKYLKESQTKFPLDAH